MEIKGIKYISPAFDNSGYAQASRGNILALHRAGVPITLSPVSFEYANPELGEAGVILKSLVNKDIDYNIVIVHTTPEFWSAHKEVTKTMIGYTVWETDKLHPDWAPYINANVSKCLVPCEWNRDVFKRSGVEVPIGVVPHGIDTNYASSDNTTFSISGLNEDTYVFYSIFQWQERKNPAGLIKSYLHAFHNGEDVALVLKTYRSSYDDKEKEAVRQLIGYTKYMSPVVGGTHPPIFLIPNMLSDSEIRSLHRRGDCYVSLDRGEGFGCVPFEAGASGNPVIITGIGGALEYAKPDNSYLVNYNLTPVANMPVCPWYSVDQLWAEPDLYDASTKMRHVYAHRDEAKDRGAKLQKYIRNNMTWDHIGTRLIEEIRSL